VVASSHPAHRGAGQGGKTGTLCGGDLLVEMNENLLDHLRIFDPGNYPDRPAAEPTGLNVKLRGSDPGAALRALLFGFDRTTRL
jgi:hypothetical protein